MKGFTLRRVLLLAFFLIVIIIAVVWFAREDLDAMLRTLGEFGYPGIFMLSFIGAASVIVPIPYTVVLLTISAPQFGFNPLLLAIVAGFGAAVGELVGYGLGYAGRRVVSKKYDHRLNAMLRIFDRFGMPAVFIFALTPLPDDLLFIPLGLMRYSLWKAFIPCVAGKFHVVNHRSRWFSNGPNVCGKLDHSTSHSGVVNFDCSCNVQNRLGEND